MPEYQEQYPQAGNPYTMLANQLTLETPPAPRELTAEEYRALMFGGGGPAYSTEPQPRTPGLPMGAWYDRETGDLTAEARAQIEARRQGAILSGMMRGGPQPADLGTLAPMSGPTGYEFLTSLSRNLGTPIDVLDRQTTGELPSLPRGAYWQLPEHLAMGDTPTDPDALRQLIQAIRDGTIPAQHRQNALGLALVMLAATSMGGMAAAPAGAAMGAALGGGLGGAVAGGATTGALAGAGAGAFKSAIDTGTPTLSGTATGAGIGALTGGAAGGIGSTALGQGLRSMGPYLGPATSGALRSAAQVAARAMAGQGASVEDIAMALLGGAATGAAGPAGASMGLSPDVARQIAAAAVAATRAGIQAQRRA